MRVIISAGGTGGVRGTAYHSTGADYAEYMEWSDGNLNDDEVDNISEPNLDPLMHSKASLLTLGCGEGKCSIYCRAPNKEFRTARAQEAQTP